MNIPDRLPTALSIACGETPAHPLFGGKSHEEVVKLWAAALRSGEYRQARERLRSSDGGVHIGRRAARDLRSLVASPLAIVVAVLFLGGAASALFTALDAMGQMLEIVGRLPPMPYWAPEAMEEYQERFAAVLAGKAPSQFETFFQRPDGQRE